MGTNDRLPVSESLSRDARFSVTGSNYCLSPEQQRLVDQAEELGASKFAPRAAQIDKEAAFPFENYADLKASGFLGLCIPKELGGLGADLQTYGIVSATLGKYCGATALTFNMHACSSLWTGLLSEPLDMTSADRAAHKRSQAIHVGRILNGSIYAQPFSEGSAAAAGKAPFGTLAKKVDGGWIINGKKIFASLADGADFFGILASEERGDTQSSMRDTLYVAVPRHARGLSIVGDWDPLGMRGTTSRTLIFNDVFVSDDEQMMPRGLYFQAAQRWPHMFTTLSPTYMGIGIAAYEFTVRYLRGEIEGMGPPVKRRQFATKQLSVAQMHIMLEQTRSLFLRMLADARIDPSKDARLRAYASQYTVMENAQDLSRTAIRTCGGQSMLKSLPLERLYRDSRCGSLMLPWTAELCLDRLGREALYESGERDE